MYDDTFATPQEYGALGNGIADDAPAIQQAIDSGGPVWIPAGTYRCATLPLRLRQGTYLQLDPRAILVRAAAGDFMVNTPGALSSATAGDYTGPGNIRIEGGVFDFKATSYSTTACNGILIGHARNIIITKTTFRDVPGLHAIELRGVEHARIWGCRFEGFLDTGSRSYSDAISLEVANSDCRPADGTACYDVDIKGCWFGNSETSGTKPWPVGVGSHEAVWDVRHRDIRVRSNNFIGCTYWAIHAYVWCETIINSNTIFCASSSPAGGGIYVRSLNMSVAAARLDVSGNSHSEGMPTNDVILLGNTIRNVKAGILVEGDAATKGGVYSAAISNNIIRGTTGNGLHLMYVSRYAGDTNIFSDISGTAMVVKNSTAYKSGNLT